VGKRLLTKIRALRDIEKFGTLTRAIKSAAKTLDEVKALVC
jgi:hypothetical protein